MDWVNDLLVTALITTIPALICITIHELAHGFTAYKLGDDTAKKMGRLTLNPIKHIDVFGLVMILTVGFGWAKPVPVNMRVFKNPKAHMAITALAGPVSNIILAVFVLFIFMMLPAPYGGIKTFDQVALPVAYRLFGIPLFTEIVFRLAIINIALALFNLLPIPPLDGSKVLFSLLPENLYYKLMKYERYGMGILLLLMLSGRFLNIDILGIIVWRPAISLLVNIADFAHNIVTVFA